jgi:hypothetical protein
MAAKQVKYTYRARLIHLERNGDYVIGDSGEPITEDVDVHLSWPAKVAKSRSPRSVESLRAAAQMAMRNANRDAITKRHFLVSNVDVVAKRTFPAR